jgi:hypothetical protein
MISRRAKYLGMKLRAGNKARRLYLVTRQCYFGFSSQSAAIKTNTRKEESMCWRDDIVRTRYCPRCGNPYYGGLGHRNCPGSLLKEGGHMLPGGRGSDVEECHCDCHKPGFEIHHMIPCCRKCRWCGKRIVGTAKFHEQSCAMNPEAQKSTARS